MDQGVTAGRVGDGAEARPPRDGPATPPTTRPATEAVTESTNESITESTTESTAGTTNESITGSVAQPSVADGGSSVAETVSAELAGVVARVSRAGRNLPAAIAVGVVLGAVLVASLLISRYIFIGLAAIAIAGGTWELSGALRRGAGIRVALVPLIVGGQAMVWLAWPFGRPGLVVAFVVTVLACLVWRFRGGVHGYVRDVTASFFVAAYVPLLAGFATMLATPADGAGRILTFLVIVVCSDIGGYAAGVFLGRHAMAPSISPKKSWEGFTGSLVAGTLGAIATVTLALDGHWWYGVLLGVAVAVTATTGDLVESMIKRDLGIKDMGTLLPGHGGLMDRLDSLLPSAFVSWLLLSLLVPP